MQQEANHTAPVAAAFRLPTAPLSERQGSDLSDDDTLWADTVIDRNGHRHVYRETD